MKTMMLAVVALGTILGASSFADEKLDCEKMSGTYEISHYGQSLAARLIRYKLSLTLDGATDVAFSTNWGANNEGSFASKELAYSMSWTALPGSVVGSQSVMAVSDPKLFLRAVNYEVNHLSVVLKHLKKSQPDLNEKKKAIGCAKLRLTAMGDEARRKYMQSTQIEVVN